MDITPTNGAAMASATIADAATLRPAVGIIEDDEATRKVLHDLLEDEGYRVLEAADGVSGLALIKSHPDPLVVLLDHHLPALDGCDLLGLVAQDATLRERRVFLLVTGSPRQAEQDCGETVDDLEGTILGKPFDIYHLLDAVTDAALRLSEQRS